MRINGQEFSKEIIRKIRLIIKEEAKISRVKLSQRICEEFNWRSSNGRFKEMSCRLALLELERKGQVVLPEPGPRPPRKAKDTISEIKEIEPTQIEDNLSGLGSIEIVKIESRHSKISGKSTQSCIPCSFDMYQAISERLARKIQNRACIVRNVCRAWSF